jgi:putative membrane protein
VLLALFAVIWGPLAIAPWNRREWLIENLLVFIALPVLILTYRGLRFSNGAYTALFVFLVLGAIGAHYTYAKVPYDEWWASLTAALSASSSAPSATTTTGSCTSCSARWSRRLWSS